MKFFSSERKNLNKINIKISIGYNILCKDILKTVDKKMFEKMSKQFNELFTNL